MSEPIIAIATTIIVPIEKDMNTLSPERNMPAIAIRTVKPEIEDGTAGGGCGGLERSGLAASGGTLLAFAPEVEERVVDPDGEPDQQDHLADLLVHREQVARQRDEGGRREHGRDREQQRNRGRDRRAEHEQQDEQRERERDHRDLAEHARRTRRRSPSRS